MQVDLVLSAGGKGVEVEDRVVAGGESEDEGVVAGPAEEVVIAAAAEDDVGAAAALDDVVAGGGVDQVGEAVAGAVDRQCRS